jgi:hypothetical protein
MRCLIGQGSDQMLRETQQLPHSVVADCFNPVKLPQQGGGEVLRAGPKFRLNIPDYFGRIRALLKSVGVEPWHVSVK